MLILTRKAGQLIRLEAAPDLPGEMSVAELFQSHSIEIVVLQVSGPQVKLGVHAHPGLRILRDDANHPEYRPTKPNPVTPSK